MTLLLGIVCVAWTSFELARMSSAGAVPVAERAKGPAAGCARTGPRRKRRFAAWDDQGRSISVEDLGRR